MLVIGVAAAAVFLVGPAAGRSEALPSPLPPSTGASYYVATNGTDTGAGTIGDPWRTVERALSAAQAGTTINLRRGTYTEKIDVGRSGTAGNPITLRSYPGERATLNGRLKVTGSYVRVADLTFVGRTSANPNEVVVYFSGASHVELSGSEVRSGALSGVYLGDPGDSTSDVFVLGNWIHDNGTHAGLDHGIYASSVRGGLIANNVIESNLAYGIQLYTDAQNVTVVDNTIVGNGYAGVLVGGNGSVVSSNNTIVNNVVAFNTREGVRGYSEGPVGKNNLVHDNVGYGNGGSGDFPASGPAAVGLTVSSNEVADPLFVKRSAHDYHLAAGSPATGRAVSSLSMDADYDGVARARPASVGAFERQGEPVPPAAPDFALAPSPVLLRLDAGASGKLTISLTRTDGFAGTVALAVGGLPSGASASFSTNPVSTGRSTLSVTTSATMPPGEFPLTVTGTSGDLVHTTGVVLRVDAPPGNATLLASPASVAPGGAVQAQWQGVSAPSVRNRIGVYAAPIRAGRTWKRVNWVYSSSCSRVRGPAPLASGSCSVAMPQTPGTYRLRITKSGSGVLAESNAVTVG